MNLREYQKRAVEMARAQYRKGHRRICLVAPTGAGKTVIAARGLASPAVDKGHSVLWIAHRTELIEQAHAKLRACGVDAGIIAPWAPSQPRLPVQVASIDTLAIRGLRPRASVVIWDECHHVAANTWGAVAADYRDATILGLTATPERADSRTLRETFDALVMVAQPSELIEMGHLVPTIVYAPPRPQKELAVDPVRVYEQRTPGAQALVFCTTRQYADDLARQFRNAGYAAESVLGDQKRDRRKGALDRFATGKTKVLTNVNVLTEGYDCPGVGAVILTRQPSTAGSWLQMVGRGLRPDGVKKCVTVLDLRGAVHLHGLPDEPREYSLEGKAIRRSEQAMPLRTCPPCGAVQKAGRPACVRCGKVFPPPPKPKIRATDVRVIEARQRKTAEEKQAHYKALVLKGQEKGYKPAWANIQYKILYGQWPERW